MQLYYNESPLGSINSRNGSTKHSFCLTLTLPHLLSHFPALLTLNFVVLPRWELWNHPERKQTILQKPISSPHPTRRKLLQLPCRTSHQEIANWKNRLPMKYRLTHPSLRGSIPNTFSYMIKFASLILAYQMLLIGKFPHWSLYLTLQKWPNHHLILSLNRPQVIVVLSSGLTPMDRTPSSISTLMVLDPLLQVCFNSIHPLPWRLRQSSPMALLKAHPHRYSRSTRPTKHLDEGNPTWSRPRR